MLLRDAPLTIISPDYSFPPAVVYTRNKTPEEIETKLMTHIKTIWRMLALLEQQVTVFSTDEYRFWLIHYDVELDNVRWNKHVNSVDFDGCAWYCFVADIAFALRDLFDDQAENIDMSDERVRAFIRR